MTQELVQVFLLLTLLFSVEAAQCPGLCSDLYIPVCTTDNQTYPNQCTADCANATVTCKHACPYGKRKSIAEKVDKMAKSKCPGLCSDLYIPVCTTDNQTYPNQCIADCSNATVTCKHACPCGKRKSIAKEVDKMAKSKCPLRCPDIYEPVCIKGNQTFPNQCIADCGNATVTCKHACPCGKQKSIQEEADKMAKSKCPGLCIDIYDPVCTKDNQTYPNQCIADCDNATVTCKHACPCAKPKSMVEKVDKMAEELDRVVIPRCNCTYNFKPVCTDNKQTLPNQCIAECINATVTCKHACPCGKPKLREEEELEAQGEHNSSRRHLLFLFSCLC
jgi:hypothetical protein